LKTPGLGSCTGANHPLLLPRRRMNHANGDPPTRQSSNVSKAHTTLIKNVFESFFEVLLCVVR